MENKPIISTGIKATYRKRPGTKNTWDMIESLWVGNIWYGDVVHAQQVTKMRVRLVRIDGVLATEWQSVNLAEPADFVWKLVEDPLLDREIRRLAAKAKLDL